MKSETRSLFNFFLSSFVNPMLRFWFPQRAKGPLRHGLPMWDTTWGNLAVYCLIIVGLIVSWFVTLKSRVIVAFENLCLHPASLCSVLSRRFAPV